MFTVTQVSKLTGISVRTLHYYDEIGLFKPSEVTEAGYRLYDEHALEVLQQILFYRELGFPLKHIKSIMLNPEYSKKEALVNQRELMRLKRDRLNNLLELLDKLIKGEPNMSFKEFDMSEYFALLASFKQSHPDKVVEVWGSMDVFDEIVEKIKENEENVAQAAIQYYGSIDHYTEAMKNHFDDLPENAQNWSGYVAYSNKTTEILEELTSDLTKDTSANEIQAVIGKWVTLADSHLGNLGRNYWQSVAKGYLAEEAIIENTDARFGQGASSYIGQALKVYWKL